MIIISFILSFFPIVFIHEFGHFIVGYYLKAKPIKFAIGMGKPIFKKKIKDTEFSLNLFPIGGFVEFDTTQFKKMEPHKELIEPWKWFFISLAGPLANFLFTYLVLFGITLSILLSNHVYSVKSSIPEYNNTQLIVATQSLSSYINNTKPDVFIYINGALKDGTNKEHDYDKYIKNSTLTKKNTLFLSIKESFSKSFDLLLMYFSETTKAFLKLFQGESSEVSGPIGIAKQADSNLSKGFLQFMFFTASLSFGLGFFNLLPIMLILDGGRALAALIESVIRKPLPLVVIENLYFLSIIMFLSIFGFVLLKDLNFI